MSTQEKLDYAQAISDWFLDLGDEEIQRGSLEVGLKYILMAGGILSSQNRDLTSVRIETSLRRVAGRLVEQGLIKPDTPVRTEEPQRCLHVITEALPAGGLTAMASRWMINDCSGRVHSVALLAQGVPVPPSLQHAVARSGGRIHTADTATSLLERAVWLRQLAAGDANLVILHVEQADVICGVAFGVPGGPPVMLVNHCAHLFWNGASTSDLIVNCRGSELEVFWSATYRGVGLPRCAIVPIPLLEAVSPREEAIGRPERSSRQALGVPQDAIVILTVGASYKYLPIDGLDFVETWEKILSVVPEAVLVAVGFEGDQRWEEASARVGNRIRMLGAMPHAQLLAVQDAADLYVEAFPFGTTTALLEAGLKGIPTALAPAQSPPPYGTDGIAIDNVLQRPADISEYRAMIEGLCRSPEKRAELGAELRNSILRHHSGDGWRRHLEKAIGSLPPQHTVLPEIAPMRTPAAIQELWSQLARHWIRGYESTLENATINALSSGLRPRLTAAVRQACRRHRALRRGHSIPMPALALLLGVVLPLLPERLSSKVFRLSVFLCRGALLSRLSVKIARLVRGRDRPTVPYEEYKRMRESAEPSLTHGSRT